MIRPEFPLEVSSQTCQGCGQSHLVIAQREVFEYNLDLIRIFLDQLVEERIDPRTVRSLEIAKNHHSHCCSCVTFEWGASQVYLDTLGK